MKLDIRKYIRCLLFVLPFLLSSCNQEDDINEIFVSGQWQLVNYYTGIDWNNYNANAKPTYTKPEDLKVINAFSIMFNDDGTVQGISRMVRIAVNGRPMPKTVLSELLR